MSDELNRRMSRVEAELDKVNPNLSQIREDLRVHIMEMAPIIRAYNENATALRRVIWTVISLIVVALGSYGILGFLAKHTPK